MENRWYKYVFVLFVFLFIFPLNSRAECDYRKMAELNRIAGNVQFNYSYDVKDGVPDGHITISNVVPGIYVVDMFGNVYREFDNVAPSAALYFYIYSDDSECGQLLQKSFKAPVYNIYYDLNECANNLNSLCDVWHDTTGYDEETFKKMVKTTSNIKSDNGLVSNEKNDSVSILLYFALILAIGIFFIINFINYKIKKGRKF